MNKDVKYKNMIVIKCIGTGLQPHILVQSTGCTSGTLHRQGRSQHMLSQSLSHALGKHHCRVARGNVVSKFAQGLYLTRLAQRKSNPRALDCGSSCSAITSQLINYKNKESYRRVSTQLSCQNDRRPGAHEMYPSCSRSIMVYELPLLYLCVPLTADASCGRRANGQRIFFCRVNIVYKDFFQTALYVYV